MPRKKPKTNDSSLCKVRGWEVGDLLKCEATERAAPHQGRVRLARITAIGEESILVRELREDRWLPERRWCRHLLDYVITRVDQKVGPEDTLPRADALG